MRPEDKCWVKPVWTCREYLDANVGLAVETNLHFNSRPSDLDSPYTVVNRCIPLHPLKICINNHELNIVNGRASAQRLPGSQAQCPISGQIITFTCRYFVYAPIQRLTMSHQEDELLSTRVTSRPKRSARGLDIFYNVTFNNPAK